MVGFKNYRIFYKIHVEEQVFSEEPYIKQTCKRVYAHPHTLSHKSVVYDNALTAK